MSILYSKEQDGTLNVLVSGKLTRDPELKSTQKGDKVKFSIAYGKKKYMDCEAWSDSDVGQLAGCLEKGDTIAATGSHRSWEYNEKTYHSVDVDAIFTMNMPSAPTASENSAPKQAEAQFEELPDEDDGTLPF